MGSLVQFVCFTTVLPQDEFLHAWEPFASGFLSRGIERIILSENAERSSESAFDYVSRNLWDESRFERAFPHGVRGSGGLGPIGVLQAGGFRLADAVNVDLAGGPRTESKVLCFLMARNGQRENARVAIRTALQHPGVAGTAIFLKDGDARTDRFDMVVEVYCREGAIDEMVDLLRNTTTLFVTAAPVAIGAYREVAEMGVEAKR
ncbi:MAG: hypothetical protein H7305_00185 [Gemmatimonadaceae bacterium]|nr:hypothetical protein [Gemmatimonadaceae bacterium]